MEYIHQASGGDAEIETISGHFTVEKEKCLAYRNRTVLCVIGMGTIDRSCCGIGGCRYAMIPGYVKKWKKKNEAGLIVSEVEPISNESEKKEISNMLKEDEIVTQTNFW
jgi:hypothetical protein